jgi:glutamate synthase domain-containing protein 3
MEDKDSKNKKNLENWKTLNFDFVSLYPNTFTRFEIKNLTRQIKIIKIWEL